MVYFKTSFKFVRVILCPRSSLPSFIMDSWYYSIQGFSFNMGKVTKTERVAHYDVTVLTRYVHFEWCNLAHLENL